MPVPKFVNALNDTIMLVDVTLNEDEILSLRQMILEMVNHKHGTPRDLQFKGDVQHLLFDSCMFKDREFAKLLRGMANHPTINSVTISNCRVGKETLSELSVLVPMLTYFRITNIPAITRSQLATLSSLTF